MPWYTPLSFIATSRSRTACIKTLSLPHTPEQNGIVAESFMGTLKLECVWQHRFKTYAEAKAIITEWIRHYNETRPYSRLGSLTPAAWHARQTLEITA
jgi:transposase InsO family protein